MQDLWIENALSVDGTGSASFHCSLAIQDGRITSPPRQASRGEPTREPIEAEGLALAPGFIDPHTHCDAQVAWDPLLSRSAWHGVTSIMTGICGVGVAPGRTESMPRS